MWAVVIDCFYRVGSTWVAMQNEEIVTGWID